MSWLDRLKTAAYNSPTGTRQEFDFEDVSFSREFLGAAFNFPDADGTYVQRLAHADRVVPLRIFIWGDDYDRAADAFENLLLEPGVGKLEHPIYGTIDVVPFGTFTRRDDLKTAANQAVFEVTFWETIGIIYPAAQDDPASAVLAGVSAFNTSAAGQFAESLGVGKAVELASFKNSYNNLLDAAKTGLQTIADVQTNVRQVFDTVYSSIDAGIDVFIDDPLDLAFQTSIFLQAPARAAAAISDRLNAYRNLAQSIISGPNAVKSAGYDSRDSNVFHTEDFYASTYVTGSVLSVVNTQFETKTDALTAAADVLDQFEQVSTWREENFAALEQIDTGESYQQLQDTVALTAGFLVAISFSLKQERRITLDRARTIIDLVAELYGTVDDQLDFFIASNQLTGSEILEVPRGREIVYYV